MQSRKQGRAALHISISSITPSTHASLQEAPLQSKFIHCSDRNVIVEWKQQQSPAHPQEVYLKYRVGAFPSVGHFHLLLYAVLLFLSTLLLPCTASVWLWCL